MQKYLGKFSIFLFLYRFINICRSFYKKIMMEFMSFKKMRQADELIMKFFFFQKIILGIFDGIAFVQCQISRNLEAVIDFSSTRWASCHDCN